MPDFIRLPDGSLVMHGAPKPPASSGGGLKAALAGFMDAMRGAPKPEQWWIEKPKTVQARAPVAVPSAAPASNAPALPAYNQWNEINAAAAGRERIKQGLGDFPKRMMASSLVEGRLF